MNPRAYRYRMKRLTRWVNRFMDEYPIETELDLEVIKGLKLMKGDGEVWWPCLNKDAYEASLYIYMASLSGQWKDHQCFYGRIEVTGITFHLQTPQAQMSKLRQKTWDILCEMLTWIEEYKEAEIITGKRWNPTPSLLT